MSKEAHLNQLADGDAVFLSTETATAWGHVGGLSVLDASDVPDFGYEKLLRSVSERLELVPRFKWKLKEVPLALDRPYWVECPEFELRNHVHRIALPAPGGPKELGELAGLLFSHPLDRSRPLWEMWLIEGLEGGKHAMFMKSHHCLMDGQAGAGLAEVLTDLTPDATAPPMVPEALVEGTPKTPSDFEVMMRAARHTVERRRKLAGHAVDAVREFVWKPWTTTRDEFTPPTWNDVPRTRFNGPVSVRRQLAFASLDLEPLKAIKKHFDVTLNDVVLELIGGALRRWLRGKGELPEQPLVAFCPVSLRSADDKSLGNQVTMMPVSMATDLDDPAERLRRIAKNSARSKECLAEGSFDVLMAMAESFAPAVVNTFMRASSLSPETVPLPGNLAVSNVRGTPVPLYTAGARIESMYPMSVLQTGQGLNATVVSYMGKMDFGFTVDPDLVPDVHELTAEVERAFEELQSAAEGVAHRAR